MVSPTTVGTAGVVGLLSVLIGACAPQARIGSPDARKALARDRSPAAQTRPANDADEGESDSTSPAERWATVTQLLQRPGVERDGVYTITIPRDDWSLAIEGMPVPAAAGVASVLHFYVCPCGKTSVAGQLCVADYELNDVIDALRAGRIEIASVAPMLLHTRPQPLLVRFQAEGKTAELARTLREAIRWTGKERMAPERAPFGK